MDREEVYLLQTEICPILITLLPHATHARFKIFNWKNCRNHALHGILLPFEYFPARYILLLYCRSCMVVKIQEAEGEGNHV